MALRCECRINGQDLAVCIDRHLVIDDALQDGLTSQRVQQGIYRGWKGFTQADGRSAMVDAPLWVGSTATTRRSSSWTSPGFH
jgi:hypothetical protein